MTVFTSKEKKRVPFPSTRPSTAANTDSSSELPLAVRHHAHPGGAREEEEGGVPPRVGEAVGVRESHRQRRPFHQRPPRPQRRLAEPGVEKRSTRLPLPLPLPLPACLAERSAALFARHWHGGDARTRRC